VPEPRGGRLLLGAFPTAEDAVAYVKRVSPVSEDEIEERWPQAREAFLTSNDSVVEREETTADPATLDALDAALRAPIFQASVQGHSWRVATVELDSLVTAQPLIQLERVAALERRLKEETLLSILFPKSASVEAHVQAPGGAAIALVTERAELAVSKIEARQSDAAGSIDVVFRLEPRPNYLTVLKFDFNLVVRNGNHRLAALCGRALGRLPCVLIEADHGTWEPRPDRFAPSVLKAPRVPRISDLIEASDASLDIELRPRQLVTLIRAEQNWIAR
jgi:hypothetical protein